MPTRMRGESVAVGATAASTSEGTLSATPMTLLLACAGLALFAQSPTTAARPVPAAARDVTELIRPIAAKSGIPALGAAIVTSDGLEALGAFGLRSSAAATPVTAGDQWHIGSCTKTLTATLAARLVERGKIQFETTVGEVFGPRLADMDKHWSGVSLELLLCHRSGAELNFDEAIWERTVLGGAAPREQRRLLVEDALRRAPHSKPDTATTYSNAGYMIAGAMLEQRADAAWEDLIRTEVLVPLGMTRTACGAPGTPERLDQPLGHVRAESGWSPIALGPGADNPAATGPAGALHTTLGDWSRFAAAHLAGARGEASFLTSASWKRLHAPRSAEWEYAPGWVVGEAKWAGGKLLRHMGSNGFWIAEASLSLERNVAILLVTNVSDDAVEAPFRELLEALIADHAAHAK
ncbi:MAG: class A beta-lactamase-related serine hydrolase, partial [Planctomycetota bacterium]